MAKSIKNDYKDSMDLNIYTTDSQEAKDFEIRSATTVFVNGESVSLEVALSNEKMNAYLKERM